MITAEKQAALSASLVLDGARFVILSDLQIAGAEGAGIVIVHGAYRNTLRRVKVSQSGLGVLITDGAGPGNVVEWGEFVGNKTHGIAVDRVNATARLPGIVRDNLVRGNGYHGIDIHGSYYRVEHNRVSDNGGGIAGTSGIHVFARDRSGGYGNHNLIRGNIVSGQVETTGRDGNGIQLDTWCDHNEVAFNLVFDNDGAGINLYDASLNVVSNNTMVGDMRRPELRPSPARRARDRQRRGAPARPRAWQCGGQQPYRSDGGCDDELGDPSIDQGCPGIVCR